MKTTLLLALSALSIILPACSSTERQAALNVGSEIAQRRGYITAQDATDLQDLAALVPVDQTSSK